MPDDRLRVAFFSEEGSIFGKRHFAALLQQQEIDLCALIVSAAPHGRARPDGMSGVAARSRMRNAAWRLLHMVARATPAIDLTAFDMATEAWIRGMAVLRPGRLKSRSFLETMRSLAPHLILCAGHQQIFPEALFRIPKIAAINFHPSLLPEGRGRNPCFWTIMTGQSRTGVTAHHISAGVDQGDMVLQTSFDLSGKETYTVLYEEVSRKSAGLIPEILAMCRRGVLTRIPQPDGGHTYREPAEQDYRIDWSQPAVCIERQIRAGMNAPGAFTGLNGKRIICCAATLETTDGPPGLILDISSSGVLVGTGDKSLRVTLMRLDKKNLSARAVAGIGGWKNGDRFS